MHSCSSSAIASSPSILLSLPIMAPFSKLISSIFLTTLLLPLQIINARESQFFSKVTPVSQNEQLPNKDFPLNNNNKPQQEQPPFVPENSENSYGLYGHETPEHYPPTTTTAAATNYKPYNTEFEDTSKYTNNKYYNFDNNNNNHESYNHQNEEEFSNSNNNNNNYYNKDSYGNFQNELSDTKYREEEYNSMDNHNSNNQMYFNNNNNRYNNPERQGMSDTRFMEGGKYYYDLDSEKYSTNNHGEAYRGVVNNNNNNNDNFNRYNYNNQGGNSYHGNYNSNQNYNNNQQEFFEDEIDDSQP